MDEFFRELDRRFQDGDLERIEGFLRDTLSRLEAEGRRESGEYASVLNEMACFFRGVSRYTEAADTFARSLELMERLGPDSPAGRTAAVMLGSTETTFYTVSVYFAAAGVRRTRHAIPAALVSDLVGFLCAGIFVRLLLK